MKRRHQPPERNREVSEANLQAVKRARPNATLRISERTGLVQRLFGKNRWTVVCSHGIPTCSCVKCGGASICEHKRERKSCKECGGTRVCPHGRQRHVCKECDGTSICAHKRIRSQCKQCEGASICEHGRQRSHCVDCGGSGICEHRRQRHLCRDCGGASICEHKRVRSYCKECGGGGICSHGRIRSGCVQCGGGSICVHKRARYICKECDGRGICEHDRIRAQCKECDGSRRCAHGRLKVYCKPCSGSGVCACGKLKVRDGVCTTCHPDYVPTQAGVSKVGCECIDVTARELNIEIQHSHYNVATSKFHRNEFRPDEMRQWPVDGYDATRKRIFEFLGDYFHGHPRLQTTPDARNHFGELLTERFERTVKKFHMLVAHGYDVYYIWESDYYDWRKSTVQPSSVWAECWRRFDGVLHA